MRTGLVALVLIVAVGLLGARLFGSRILQEIVVREAERVLAMEIRFSTLRLTIVPASVAIEDFELVERGETLLTARRVGFELAALRSLWDGAWIGDIAVDEPTLRIEDAPALWRRLETRLRSPTGGAGGEESFRPRTLSVRAAELDLAWPSEKLRAEARDLSLEVRIGGLLRPTIEFETVAKIAAVRQGHRLALERVAAQGKVSSRGFAVESLVVDGDAGPLRGTVAVEDRRIRGRFDFEPRVAAIFALVPEAGSVRGSGRIAATLGGTLSEPEIRADLIASDVGIDDVEFSGSGVLTTEGDRWKIERAKVRIFGGEAEGGAHGKVAIRVPFEAEARFTGWDPATFLRLFDVETPIRGAWNGEARIAGDLFGDDLRGGGKFTLSESGETLGGNASFALARERVEVEGSLRAEPENEIRARFRVIQDSDIAGEVDVRGERLAVFAPFVGLAFDGKGRGKARFLGTLDQPAFAGDVDLRDVSVLGVGLGAVRGPFEITGKGFSSSRFEIADGEITASGRLALTGNQQNEWSAKLQALSLSRTKAVAAIARWSMPEVSGKATGVVRAGGPWRDLALRSEAEVADLVVAGEEGGRGKLEIVRDANRWSASADLARSDGATIQARGERSHDGAISGRLTTKGLRFESVAALRRDWPTVRAGLDVQVDASGTQSRPRGRAKLGLVGVQIGDAALGDGQLLVDSDGKEAAVEVSIATVRLKASIAVQAPNASRATIAWQDFEVGALLSRDIGLRVSTSGDADLAGDRDRPLGRGSARITALRIGRDAEHLELAAPVSARIDDGRIEIADAVLTGSSQKVTVGARWAPEEASFHAAIVGDLAVLESLSTQVASARGAIDARLDGTRKAGGPWHYRGQAELSHGAVDLAFLVGATDVSAKLAIDDRKVTVGGFEGKVGGGDFLVSGAVVLDGDWDLGWALRDASLGTPSWIDYRGSGRGKVVGPFGRPRLQGEVEIDQALYDRRIEWSEFLPWFRKQTRAAPIASLPLDVDVHVFADGGLFVDNNLAKVEARGDLRVHGGSQALSLDGTIDVVSGEFIFRRRRFTITSGLVRFHEDEPANPELSFGGETRIATREEEYEITVQVSGTADDPRIEFSVDDSALTENDVLALVTFGRTVAQLQSQGAGIELGEALALTAGPRGEEVQKELHTLIPVDRIEIEPSFSRMNGGNEPRLSIAKDLTERFSAVIGTGLGSERNQDVALEYQLTKRFSLQGIWESQTKNDAGAFGGNVKFRVPFRGLPRFSLLPGSGERR